MSEVQRGIRRSPLRKVLWLLHLLAAALPQTRAATWQCEMVQQLKAVYGPQFARCTFAGQNYLIADRSICLQLLATLCAEHGLRQID